jgi:hypothetical protein
MSPVRIQRKRSKDWRMPENAVYVGRSSRYGNPFAVGHQISPTVAEDFGPDTISWFGRMAGEIVKDRAEAVELFRLWVADCATRNVPFPTGRLRGKNLCCWCPLDQPCHADVLLELANK